VSEKNGKVFLKKNSYCYYRSQVDRRLFFSSSAEFFGKNEGDVDSEVGGSLALK